MKLTTSTASVSSPWSSCAGQTLKTFAHLRTTRDGAFARAGDRKSRTRWDSAHSEGIVHRDIKPANIFVTERGQAKVLDFGLAKLLPRIGDKTVDARNDSTRGRRAPHESGRGAGYSRLHVARAGAGEGSGPHEQTYFSFGVVLYEMATGRMAFTGSTSAAIFDLILHRRGRGRAGAVESKCVPKAWSASLTKRSKKNATCVTSTPSDLRTDLKRLKRETDSLHVVRAAEETPGQKYLRRPASGSHRGYATGSPGQGGQVASLTGMASGEALAPGAGSGDQPASGELSSAVAKRGNWKLWLGNRRDTGRRCCGSRLLLFASSAEADHQGHRHRRGVYQYDGRSGL